MRPKKNNLKKWWSLNRVLLHWQLRESKIKRTCMKSWRIDYLIVFDLARNWIGKNFEHFSCYNTCRCVFDVPIYILIKVLNCFWERKQRNPEPETIFETIWNTWNVRRRPPRLLYGNFMAVYLFSASMEIRLCGPGRSFRPLGLKDSGSRN